MDKKRIVLFNTTHETLKAEKYLNKHNIPYRPVIKPRKIESNCGMGLEVDAADIEKVVTLCAKEELNLTGTYKNLGSSWEKVLF